MMRSPTARLAAAAAIAAICLTGLLLWKGTGSGVTLADVLDKLEQVTTYSYQTRSTLNRPQDREERLAHVLISRDTGSRITTYGIDPNTGETQLSETDYVLPDLGCILFINHSNKTSVRLKYENPAALERYRGENCDPQAVVKELLKHNPVRLGQSVIDGTTVEGFRTTDPNYEDSFLKISDWMGRNTRADVTLWVDARTLLPVRMVEDIVKESGTRFHEVSDHFRWNVVLNESDFEPNIPDGYTAPIGDVVMPVFSEEKAIKGLRLFADLTGKYPVGLTKQVEKETFTEEVMRLVGYDDSYDTLPQDEKTRITSNSILLGTPWYFYEGLARGNKDPAYYGETVKPGDADKVLLRWRLDDGQYRAVFGDLSSRTVTVEALGELEKQ
ncbi:MAG: hypothetical protein KBE65_01880 [Phycisphaerae bacterium]|nr:hypothetical protein [Phycisphaerae bacterium]